MKSLRSKLKAYKEKLAHAYKVCEAYDLPESIGKRTVFIIGNQENPWLLAFQCPCGCKNIIQLNLLYDVYPNWSYSINRKKITVRPSIWRKHGCKSHFFLKNGKILWV